MRSQKIVFSALLTISLIGCDQATVVKQKEQQQIEQQSEQPDASQDEERSGRLTPSPPAQPLDPIQGERLLAAPPADWVQGFATNTPTLKMVEYLPADSGDSDWIEKVSFESFSAVELPDPIEFVTGIATDQAAACENFEHFNILSARENGYPTSVRLMVCPESSLVGKGQVTLIKAIQGNDRFYVITRAKRVPAPAEGESVKPIAEAEMALWSTYVRAITVCDADRGDAHPCPDQNPDSTEP